jgi:hypothetical protein
LLDADSWSSRLYVKLDGFGRQFDKNIKSEDLHRLSAVGLSTVAASEEAINIDDIFEETPFRRIFLLMTCLKADHGSDH